MRILSVPAVTRVVGEEAPCELVVLVLHQNAHTASLTGSVQHVFLPDDRQKQRPGRIHDRDVREQPAAVILLQQLDHTEKERVLGNGAHGIIGNSSGDGAAHPGGVGEQGVQATVAALGKTVRNPLFRYYPRIYSRRPSRCMYHHNAPARNTGSSLRAGSGTCNHQRCPRTRDIPRQ